MWKQLALNYIIRWIILSYHGSKVSGLDSLDCDFEEGICKWSQRQGDDFDWKVGATSTNNTGPDGDHTTGDGYYAYIDTNSEDLENNDKAFLVSPQKTEGTYCFSLWYYMYGKQVVTLTVFQTPTPDGRKRIFEINSSPEQRWMLKAINISSTSNFKIIIRGTVSISESRVSGVIAVDDILMLSGNCPSECDDPTPTNGSVDSEIFKLGSVVGITCMSGYILIGRSSITCLANGTWSGKPECHLIECSNPVPENGMSNSTKFRYGSVVKITCNDGYKISGISVIYCQANRNWTATPTCSFIDCLIPKIANGIMSGPRNNTKYNHTVDIVCEDNYDLVGNENITCQADGHWSAPPICILHADDQTGMDLDFKAEESVNKSGLTAIYVTVPLVVVALIIVVTTIIWRKKIVQFFAVRRSHGQVKKEQPQPKTLFTNMAYSESFNEILPKKGDALSQDDEYADITDDRHETGQSKTTEYSNTVTVIKETEHSYDHMKKSGMSIIDNTYSHIPGNKSIYTSSNITTESSLSGNASYQSNTRHNIDNCDLRNPKEPRRNLQSNMLDEQESEYDHAQAGGTNPPDTDDYSHLNVGADKSESERDGTRKNLQSNMLDKQESEYDHAQAGGTNPPDTDDYSHLNVGADKSESERYGTRKNLQSNMLDEQESEYDHAQAGGTNPPDTDDYSHLNVGADKSESERYGTRKNLQSNMLDEQESEYDHDQAGGTNPPDTDDYSHLKVGADKSKSECSEIKYFTLDTFNAMYCNVREQTERSSIEYDYAYKKPIDESPEYFVLEPKSADTAEDVKD